MPVMWEWRGSVLVLSLSGPYTNAELAGALVAGRADPRFAPGASILFDGRESRAELTKDDVQWRLNTLAASLRQDFGPRMALLLTADEPHRYGVARMVQARLEQKGFEAQIFSDFVEALRWASGDESR